MHKIAFIFFDQLNATNIVTADMMRYEKFNHSRNVGFFSHLTLFFLLDLRSF